MFKSLSPEKRQAWREKIEQQQRSGQSVTQWCRENEVSIGQFYYWKGQFFPRQVKRSEFLELTSPKKTEIRIECNRVYIDVEPHFDSLTLSRCLILIRELPC